MDWFKVLLAVVLIAGVVIWLGLPWVLHVMGLHPSYDMPHFDLRGKRALVITTSHSQLGDTGKATGVFGSEMTVPYYAFLDAGMSVDIASIKGGEIPVEPFSMGWPLATPEDKRFRKDREAMAKLKNSVPVSQINPADYDVYYMAGGWGAAYDLAQSEALADLITRANEHGKILGSVCHGALGLVSAKNTDGRPLIEGRKVTGVTNRQIKQLGIEVTPKHPETEMRKSGAIFESRTSGIEMFATHVVVDGNIITGQNQNSGYETSHRILEAVNKIAD
ncbi:MAG: type 1 glutamine amidotransferase domain-containing protein [Saccharospirillaceae bacterium]|nr:type 1 glutamine amidotransferase domain-containing protein [Saccharospirillaceae bacterium]MCD8533171.1 type 1 glutamine amidotransferase domain-containing protein [Saccharospirillaceae bacterium]